MLESTKSPEKFAYSTSTFDFRASLKSALTYEGASIADDSEINNPDVVKYVSSNLQTIRTNIMEELQGNEFQNTLLAFSKHLASMHFTDEPVYFQKTPSVRLSLPGALGTSWHTDNWYGHATDSYTFWVPISRIAAGAGVQFIDDANFLSQVEKRLQEHEIELEEINTLCAQQGAEQPCNYGEYLKFGGRTLHGSVGNTSDSFRCSLDFRGCKKSNGVGNKPLSNYRLISSGDIVDSNEKLISEKAVKYINGSSGTSTKYQHIIVEAYTFDNKMNIVRNEAEIETIPSLPVLYAYASRAVPNADEYKHVILHSIQLLPSEKQDTLKILDSAEKNNVSIHFVLEDITFPGALSKGDLVAKVYS